MHILRSSCPTGSGTNKHTLGNATPHAHTILLYHSLQDCLRLPPSHVAPERLRRLHRSRDGGKLIQHHQYHIIWAVPTSRSDKPKYF